MTNIHVLKTLATSANLSIFSDTYMAHIGFFQEFTHFFTKFFGESEVKKLTVEIVEAWQRNRAAKLRGQARSAS
jgi:hypothetical protein